VSHFLHSVPAARECCALTVKIADRLIKIIKFAFTVAMNSGIRNYAEAECVAIAHGLSAELSKRPGI
jgi:hypothetical protein